MVDAKDGAVMVAVLDGHGGWEVAEFVSSRLATWLQTQVRDAEVWSGNNLEVERRVTAALNSMFLGLDDAWFDLIADAGASALRSFSRLV